VGHASCRSSRFQAISTSLTLLAKCYRRLGDTDKEQQFLKESLKVQEQHYVREDTQVCETLEVLAMAACQRGNYREASGYVEESVCVEESGYVEESVCMCECGAGGWAGRFR
jgi:tetratricopeptide (TPR) repeat protein